MEYLIKLKKTHLSAHNAIIFPFLIFGLTACIDLSSDSKTNNEQKASIQLKETESQQELKQYLIANFTQVIDRSGNNELAIEESIAVTEDAMADASESDSSTANFSGTNNQVQGVDEGDIWKYDGENFFILKPAVWGQDEDDANCIVIESIEGEARADVCPIQLTLQEPAQLRIVKNDQQNLSSLIFDDINPNELYLKDQSLLVLGNKTSYQNNWDSYQNWQDGQNTVTIINIEDKTKPSITTSLALDGYLIQSRRVGDGIFIVSRYSPNIPDLIYSPQTEAEVLANKKIIDNLNLNDLMPKIKVGDQEKNLITDNTCLIPNISNANMGSPSLTMLTRINIKTAAFSTRCMAGEVAGMYMSESSLYTFNTSYWDFSDDLTDTFNWNSGNTHLHKFDLASFDYKGSALIEGQLASYNPRLRLGELSDGSIALVTSKISDENQWLFTDHQLTVLSNQDNNLSVIATLPNEDQPKAIGKVNEQIYSVRFMQNRAYIVTFEKVDPLYVIDLSNPSQPTIAGELEIPGYSDYLHPIGNDLLLGIGKDAIVGESGTSWYQGVKVSLFDVKDIQQPTELGNIIIGKRGTSTALSHDLHSFSGIQQDDQYRFAFPISVHNRAAQEYIWRDPESQFYQWSQTGLYLFEVKNDELSQAGALITDRSTDENTVNNHWYSNYSRRGLIQEDEVYHLISGGLYKANWNSPEEISDKF